jgi:hypothetical protein
MDLVVPGLRRALALPVCAGVADLEGWVRAVCAPYVTVDPAPLEPTSHFEVVAVTPVLRDLTPAMCWWIGRVGAALCWQAVDAAGVLVARMVSAPWPNRRVPPSIVSHSLTYHQEWIGSGHPFAGFVEGGRLEGLCGDRLVIGEFGGQHIAPDDDYYVARTLLENLFVNALVAFEGSAALFVPEWLPPGMSRVTGRVHFPPADGVPPSSDWVEGVEYGDGIRRGLRIRHHLYPPGEGLVTEVNGLSAWALGSPGNEEVIVKGHYTWIGAQNRGGVTVEQLIRVLTSLPGLQPAMMNPASGSHDLRDLLSPEWLGQLLAQSGCTAIEPRLPGAIDFSCVMPSGTPARVIFQPQEPWQHAHLTLTITGTRRVRTTDLFVSDHQAYGICHCVFVNVITWPSLPGAAPDPDEALDLAAAIVRLLDDTARTH